MRARVLCLSIVALLPSLSSLRSAESGKLEDELMRHAQELFDAVAAGNREPWKKYFAEDCLFFDEKGHNFPKPEFVADIRTLPNGYSAKITVGKRKSVIIGHSAGLMYDV